MENVHKQFMSSLFYLQKLIFLKQQFDSILFPKNLSIRNHKLLFGLCILLKAFSFLT